MEKRAWIFARYVLIRSRSRSMTDVHVRYSLIKKTAVVSRFYLINHLVSLQRSMLQDHMTSSFP